MRKTPFIKTGDFVSAYREALCIRRDFCPDDQRFFKMPDFLEYLAEDPNFFRIKVFKKNGLSRHEREATILSFDGRYTLTVDEHLMENARGGCWYSNFTLAHEVAHIINDDHKDGADRKHFKLFDGPSGRSNIPPTTEEMMANFGAVFFQCGVLLEDPEWLAVELARRASSDPLYVEKAQLRLKLDVVQRELSRRHTTISRVIL